MRLGPYDLNTIVTGDARELAADVPDSSVDLVFWSGPYFVGKSYESNLTFNDWFELMRSVVYQSARMLGPGMFLVVNCADILAFADDTLPAVRNNVLSRSLPIGPDDILPYIEQGLKKNKIAEILEVSEQTIDRRMNGNNARGAKKETQTRIEAIQPHIIEMASASGLYFYDRRIWVKDPAWQSCQWHTMSYRSVDEFEYLLIFAKPGVITIDRQRLAKGEWGAWGSRGVWCIPSVRANDIHEAMFPLELARRVISLFSPFGGLVIDLFIGSGTTAMACKITGRNYWGCEIDPATAARARERVAMIQPPLFVVQPEQAVMEL